MPTMTTPSSAAEAAAVLAGAAARGVAVYLVGGQRIGVRPLSGLTRDEREALQARADVAPALARELARRVAVMREQVPAWPVPIPVLVACRDVRPLPGACVSCAERLIEPTGGRCALCSLAAWMAVASYPAPVVS